MSEPSEQPIELVEGEGDGEGDIIIDDDYKIDEEIDDFENDIILEDDISAVYDDIASQLEDTESKSESKSESKPKSFRTTRFLTKYERTRVLGIRATQIARGAPPLINLNINGRTLNDPKEIAEQELLNRKLFFIIKRRLPSKVMHKPNYEYVHLNQLIL